GVGQHDVEATEVLDAGIHRGLDLLEVAHIGHRAQHLAAGLFDPGDGLVQLLAGGHRIAVGGDVGADVDADDVGALACESYRVAAALATRHPGDEGDFAI